MMNSRWKHLCAGYQLQIGHLGGGVSIEKKGPTQASLRKSAAVRLRAIPSKKKLFPWAAARQRIGDVLLLWLGVNSQMTQKRTGKSKK